MRNNRGNNSDGPANRVSCDGAIAPGVYWDSYGGGSGDWHGLVGWLLA